MTRETKVGLMVAASFLSLVGVVVAARLSRPEGGPSQELVQAPEARTEATKGGAEKRAAEKTPQAVQASPFPTRKPPVLNAKHEEPASLAMANAKPLEAQAVPPTKDPEPASVSNPPPVKPPAASDPAMAIPNPDPKPAANDISEEEQKKKLQALANAVKPTPQEIKPAAPENGPAPANPDKNVARVEDPKSQPVPAPAPSADSKGAEPAPTPPPSAPPVTDSKPATPDNAKPPVVVPVTDAKPGTPPPASPVPEPSPKPTDPGAVALNNTPPSGPGPVSPPPAAEKPVPPPAVNPSPNPTPSPATPAGSEPGPRAAVPPLGAPPSATSPPITIGASPSGASQIDKYDVESYVTRAEDRSLADLSMKLYNSDKYGQALVLFNRDHPQASAGMRQDPPQMTSGQTIFVPPVWILEKKYSGAIGSPTAAPGPNRPPLTPGNPAAATVPPANTQTAWAGTGKTYRVPDGGQHIIEIARNVLGNSQRWPAIYQANPSINPQYPIPGGTILNLPK
jgi:hypothetical protein